MVKMEETASKTTKKETATQKKKEPEDGKSPGEVKDTKDKSPTTPTTNWWGGWISQAKEKVSLATANSSSEFDRISSISSQHQCWKLLRMT